MLAHADLIVTGAFGYKDSGSGIRERVVRQYLANAAYNQWPSHATQQMWDGILESSQEQCWQDRARWQRDPMFVSTAARLAVLLQYVPYNFLVAAALTGGITDPLARTIVRYWGSNEELVAD